MSHHGRIYFLFIYITKKMWFQWCYEHNFFLIYVKLSLLKCLQIPNTNLIADSLGYVIYQVWLLMRKTKVAEIYTGGHNKQNKPNSRQNVSINKNRDWVIKIVLAQKLTINKISTVFVLWSITKLGQND